MRFSALTHAPASGGRIGSEGRSIGVGRQDVHSRPVIIGVISACVGGIGGRFWFERGHRLCNRPLAGDSDGLRTKGSRKNNFTFLTEPKCSSTLAESCGW